MAENKRTNGEKERDRAIIAKLSIEGYAQSDIAVKLQEITGNPYRLSQSQISRDLAIISEQWEKERIEGMRRSAARELTKLDYVEHQYWRAWTASRGEQTKTRYLDAVESVMVDEGGSITNLDALQKGEDEPSIGSIQALNGIQGCIDKRCKILGLYGGVVAGDVNESAGDKPLNGDDIRDWIDEVERERNSTAGEPAEDVNDQRAAG